MCESVFVDAEDNDNEEPILPQTSSDPTEALNRELHNIRLDLQTYQQDKTQLQYVLRPECPVTILAGVSVFCFCKALILVKDLPLSKQDMAQASKNHEKLAPDNRQRHRY